MRNFINLSVCLLIAAIYFSGSSALAKESHGSCKKIKAACVQAGFVKGEAKRGKGLWMDCVNPIMQGTIAKKSVLPLPTVDPKWIEECKSKTPHFGSGAIGN